MNPEWLTALAALITIVAGILAWGAQKVWYVFRRTDQFLEDWNGVSADKGHEGYPGVMTRLLALEHSMTDIQGQVHLNSGHSMRDEVQRTEAAVEELTIKLGKVELTVNELNGRQ